jgi:hypothetical protein
MKQHDTSKLVAVKALQIVLHINYAGKKSVAGMAQCP